MAGWAALEPQMRALLDQLGRDVVAEYHATLARSYRTNLEETST